MVGCFPLNLLPEKVDDLFAPPRLRCIFKGRAMASYKGVTYRKLDHANTKGSERGVSDKDIRQTLDDPDTDLPSRKHPGRRVLSKRLSRRFKVSIVIYPPGDKDPEVVVVTAWSNQ